ncbi:MAG: putative enoyl-CoA hydratase [Bradyrhizobium sp.]|nr:putative enoyl-CoA hydratase [Bradyrhizobium sp.]
MQAVLESLDRGLLTISLNIPERRNALNTETALLLLAAVERAAVDTGVRAVLLRGAGGTFCVGGDVKGMGARKAAPPGFEAKLALMNRTMEIARLLHEMPKPVVVAVEGAAAGAGLSIALSADFRVVGENAKITTAFAKVGVSGDYGGIWFITQMLGSARARELALLSPVLSGTEAHALGLMTRLTPDAEVGDVAHALARSLADGPTVALGYLKMNVNNAEGSTLAAYLGAEALHQCRCLQSEDHREATAAFVEKRSPVFVGR